MVSSLESLLARAFLTCPAREANAAIARVREAGGEGAIAYEVVLDGGRGWAYLAGTVLPRLARFLVAKRLRVEACAPVFLPIFAGETLHFLRAPELFACYREVEGLSEAELSARARAWEREGESAPLALLPA